MNFEPRQDKTQLDDRELPRLRAELAATEQIYDGEPYWVIKDPLSLRYFRFSREEYFIIERLRRGVTLRQLKEAHRREFQAEPLSNDELARFISALTARNLVIMRQPDRDEILFGHSKRRWRLKLKSQLSNFMFFKIPLYDPDNLFNRLIPYLRFFWTRAFLIFYLALLTAALILILRRWNDFTAMFHAHFFTLRNIPLLFISVWFIKALHEFGHGLTCKNYGGEVHEMGWLFLVFTPFFYCNVTDAWTFTDKARRLLVTAAGIMTELMFAAAAAFCWYFTEAPGFIHTLTFNVIIACSISTVLFNANPLLKYDGYYMLMDLIEVPNLRQRSAVFMKNFFVRYILGGRPEEMPEEHRFSCIFPVYSVLAYFYRWFIIIVILYFVYRMLDQLRLTWLGRFLVVFSAGTMLIWPLARGGNLIVKSRHALGISRLRLLLWLALIIVGAGTALFWPLARHITLPFILEPQQAQWLRAEAPGILTWDPHIRQGAWLDNASDQTLVARLQNDELHFEKQKLQAALRQIDLQIYQYKMRRLRESLIEQLQQRRDTLIYDLEKLDEQIADLNITIPFSGEVLLPDDQIRLLQGKFFERGEPLLLLADTRRFQAKVWVPEKTWARIFKHDHHLNQPARLMLYAFSKETFTGRVAAVSSQRQKNMGLFEEKLPLSSKVGGEVLTEYDPLEQREKPLEAVYEVTIRLDDFSLPAPPRPAPPLYVRPRTHRLRPLYHVPMVPGLPPELHLPRSPTLK